MINNLYALPRGTICVVFDLSTRYSAEYSFAVLDKETGFRRWCNSFAEAKNLAFQLNSPYRDVALSIEPSIYKMVLGCFSLL